MHQPSCGVLRYAVTATVMLIVQRRLVLVSGTKCIGFVEPGARAAVDPRSVPEHAEDRA